jgi:hypothetical protein
MLFNIISVTDISFSSGRRDRYFICGDGAVHTSSILQIDARHPFKSQGPSQKLTGEWSVFNHEVNNGDGGFLSGNFLRRKDG